MEPLIEQEVASQPATVTLITVFDDVYNMFVGSPLATVATITTALSIWVLARKGWYLK